MGTQSTWGAQLASAHSALNMKLLVVLALAAIAAAEPEAEAKADPYLLYGGYGLGHYGYGLGHYGYGHGLYYGKREAEAEPYYGYSSSPPWPPPRPSASTPGTTDRRPATC